jgi:hypothetical protein
MVQMLRILVISSGLVMPLAVLAQSPMTQPMQLSPADSDILRRSQRALPDAEYYTVPPAPPRAVGPQSAPPGSFGGLVQADGRIVVTRDLCNQVNVEHHPAPDVNYRPGVDVYGNPVVPPDLPSAGPYYGGVGASSSTDLLITPQNRVVTRGGVTGETYVGRVTVDPAGRVALNGQPLESSTQIQLQQLCARAGY